jgi:SSS family solute:Na+ symporter
LFWKKTTNKGAIVGVLSSIPIAMYFKVAPKEWSSHPVFVNVPFLDQMGYTLVLTMLIIAVYSIIQHKGKDDANGIPITKELFKTSPLFNIGAFAIMIILVVLYAMFWS